MRARLLRILGNLRESYWFVPANMALLALLLAVALIYVDAHFTSAWFERIAWLQAGRPDGARGLLTAVAGSMLGVAGTTFSVTIAAVVYASGQYGPRLLSNFMADRGNQVTLGTFIATFLYSVVVVRTIRSPGEGGVGDGGFVPQLALIVALLLVLASIAVLIFFIHHVPRRIHINSVIEQIGRRLLDEIETHFPAADSENDSQRRQTGRVPQRCAETVQLRAAATGYLQIVDHRALVQIACEADLFIDLKCQPGDFAHQRTVLAEVSPASVCDEEIRERLCASFAFGSRRTPMQDLRFLVDELVEIAARALSPGVNDPFTARSCMDWLAAAMAELGQRAAPSPFRVDDEGVVRVVTTPIDFAVLAERSFGALAQYASADMIAAMHYLMAICDVALACNTAERRLVVRHKVEAFRSLSELHLKGVNATSVSHRASRILECLGDERRLRELRYGMT